MPDYRGAAPINFAIINGEEKTELLFINEKIDEGNILLQKNYNFPMKMGSRNDRLMEMGAKLVVKTLDGLQKFYHRTTNRKLQNLKITFKILKRTREFIGIKRNAENSQFHRGNVAFILACFLPL